MTQDIRGTEIELEKRLESQFIPRGEIYTTEC
jgi:hypothetical protein